MSGRLMVNIAYRHLRPMHHDQSCADGKCSADCPIRAFSEALATPILASEIAEEQAREERFRAFAEQLNSFSRGE